MMRICSAIDLGFWPPTRRLSRSTTRASSLPMVSFRPETVSSVMGAIVEGEERSQGREQVQGGREDLGVGEMEMEMENRNGSS